MESDDLLLLERVALRLVHADTDKQLEASLDRFLCPVMLKLSTNSDRVRRQVVELLTHVKTRLQSSKNVQVPMKQLVSQYIDKGTPSIVTNFTIIFLRLGFHRLSAVERTSTMAQLVPVMLTMPEAQQNILCRLLLLCLQDIIGSDQVPGKLCLFQGVGADVLGHILKLFIDVLLLPYSALSVKRPVQQPASDSVTATAPVAPPGLSNNAVKRLTDGEDKWDDKTLEGVKVGIIHILSKDIFAEDDVITILLMATADTRHSVCDAADKEFRRRSANQDWNNPVIVKELYQFYQGTATAKGKTAVSAELKRSPASVAQRLKLMPYLLKSRQAAAQFPACLQVVFDGLYGENTNARLKELSLHFVHHLCLHCPDSVFVLIGQILLSGLTKLLSEMEADSRSRGLTYVAIGKVARRVPAHVSKDVTLLHQFFEALKKEEGENRLSVQEALSLMSECFKNLDPSQLGLLEALVGQNLERAEQQAREVAVMYAKAVFPPGHQGAAYLLLIATGDSKEEIRREAWKALISPLQCKEGDGFDQFNPSQCILPDFSDFVKFIHGKATVRLQSASRYMSGSKALPFNPQSYVQVLSYLRLCLACQSEAIDLPLHEDDYASVTVSSPRLGRYVRNQLLTHAKGLESVKLYITMLHQLLDVWTDEQTAFALLEIIAVTRDSLCSQFTSLTHIGKIWLNKSMEKLRVIGAELLALLIVYGKAEEPLKAIELNSNALNSQVYEAQHGSLLALGYLISYYRQANPNTQKDATLTPIIDKIVSCVSSTTLSFAVAACHSLSEIGRQASLPVPDTGTRGVSKESLVQLLLDVVQSSKQPGKLREVAATTLGCLCSGEVNFPYQLTVINGLLDSAGPKQIDLNLVLGEAIVAAMLGACSPERRDKWLVSEEEFSLSSAHCEGTQSTTEHVVKRLLSEMVASPKPYVRQAGCMWLLALTQAGAQLPVVQHYLLQIQNAFMNLLKESDDFTQDAASKGLSVVYDKCNEEQKNRVVSSLVDALTSGKRQKVSVSDGDTQVFEDQELGNTPDGQGLATYKELCAIATDLNQPDLIYKFMSLANHNATWNAKKGAAFGFQRIAAQAGEQLAPHLSRILPKLYRYQYDPNPRVQAAMMAIWNGLVKDNKKAISQYESAILAELVISLTAGQWRVRESSCTALAELLRMCPPEGDTIDQLPELWTTCLRVRDDIKESVRKAAEVACRQLSKVSVKVCDPEQGRERSAKATSVLLPALLKAVVHSNLPEARALSLTTLVKISKNAGSLLTPYIALLVPTLLESLSTLEPQILNYYALHAAADASLHEKLDSARAAASKSSPMMEVVNMCVMYLEADVMEALVPQLQDLIKSGIGLATRTGCNVFIVSAVSQKPTVVSPYAGKLMGALLTGLADRNTTIKNSCASTIGHLARVARGSSIDKLLQRLTTWYLEKEDDTIRQACAVCVQAIANHSHDAFMQNAATALPLSFLAMHEDTVKKSDTDRADSSDDRKAIWSNVWSENTAGTETGIKLYLNELLELCKTALESSSWQFKAQGALAMATIATKLGQGMKEQDRVTILDALLKAMPGRTWQGKEALLKAVRDISVAGSFTSSSPATLYDESVMDTGFEVVVGDVDPQESSMVVAAVVETMIKECKKDYLEYRTEALACTAAIVQHYQVDAFRDIYAIISPLLVKRNETNPEVKQSTWLVTEQILVETIGQCWPRNQYTQILLRDEVLTLLSTISASCVWKVKVAVLQTYSKFISRLHFLQLGHVLTEDDQTFAKTLVEQVVPKLCEAMTTGISSVKVEGLSTTEVLCETLNKAQLLMPLLGPGEFDGRLSEALQGLSVETMLEDRCKHVLSVLGEV